MANLERETGTTMAIVVLVLRPPLLLLFASVSLNVDGLVVRIRVDGVVGSDAAVVVESRDKLGAHWATVSNVLRILGGYGRPVRS
ncbi:uncharacterized protein BDW43DRAFT_261672 [Aspergillus alliaceus]|uniref:uncharacterized protein n=1 Tax=Petromyces alliaceus TaxID=209559 RepID=UPI0012A4B28A|nr:uncharacterized protein BDW43DRAFT_261672 [Aspergillus alliaceus]KAB8238447.1 hypothetical protein BDW43DRAFT_261672 [Aspergillus alliaceus]